MLYDLASPYDFMRLSIKLERYKARGAVVEFTEKSKRTRAQNNYLHLCLGVVAMEVGNTLEYVKEIYFKRLCNPDIFIQWVNDAHAGAVEVVRSSADLNPEEMTRAIDKFSRWSAEELGCYIPKPTDAQLLQEIELEMSRQSKYL